DDFASIAGQFITISCLIAGDLIDQGNNATGLLGFSYGGIDAMSHQAGLDVRLLCGESGDCFGSVGDTHEHP
ncbi:hypothetical protein ACGTRS_32190, partial [Burkholderia semiarida]